ncbi:MOSC domain-containing protein [Paralimibaculum aggregatum]|uniref:MOSC domain-containing protein n=1 Tax=Paralimibaculum aggregatum TaxID=3036245 RepID=A0ABQ6LHY2_9RHOB|nr:sulfurase [Limibaculum sp. NKW23]GMG82894.1 MOSC domain-containing protein [Limibaculum sp. NKW23]
MSILKPTELYGEVVWLGLVPEGVDHIRAEAVDEIALDWGGPVGDVHHGETRPSCVRVRRQYPKGTEIRNVRQLSILSEEEMAEIAAGLGIPHLAPEWLGATLVLRGIPDLTLLPPASRLIAEGAAPALTTDTENGPCQYPAAEIERVHPGRGEAFPKIARHKRGITAWVERPGQLALGDRLRLHLPPQHRWAHG